MLQPVIRCERRKRREIPGSNGAYISLSKLGSSAKYTNHALSEKTRALCRSIYITPIPTWMIFEETGLPSVETAMGEYLQPEIFIFNVRQRRQVLLRNGRSASSTRDTLSNLVYKKETADKTHRRAALTKVRGVLAEPREALREGAGYISGIRIHVLGGEIHETASGGTSRDELKEKSSAQAGRSPHLRVLNSSGQILSSATQVCKQATFNCLDSWSYSTGSSLNCTTLTSRLKVSERPPSVRCWWLRGVVMVAVGCWLCLNGDRSFLLLTLSFALAKIIPAGQCRHS